MIKIEHLNKYFNKGQKNENYVLKDINLEFEPHGLVCILGESGCGKTTLLNTAGGLDVFDTGKITIDDTVVEKYTPAQIEQVRNDKFGYVFQNYYLLQDYTVYYNIKLALNLYDLSEEEKEARVDYVLDALEMKKYKKKLVSQLSGGQQQRVSIARALVKSPQIIMADEPTGNLDEENTIRTMSILKSISKECLVIVVTHEKTVAKFFADRIIKIKDGAVVKDYINDSKDAYTRQDDGNIYLKELKRWDASLDKMDVHLFGDDDEDSNIVINLAYKDGKLYLQNLSNVDIIMAGDESGCQMIDDYSPKLEMEEVDDFDYKLEHLKPQKKSSLSFNEIKKMAFENLSLMGKKQVFIIVVMLLTAVMMTLGVADYMNKLSVDKRSVVTTDSHYTYVKLSNTKSVDYSVINQAVSQYMDEVFASGKYTEIFPNQVTSLSLQYEGFTQLTSVNSYISDCSYVPYSHLKKSSLTCGRMPENSSEAVVDTWLLYLFKNSDSLLSQVFTSDKSFLGQKFYDSVSGNGFKIVGVCDTDEPAIYINDALLYNATNLDTYFASIDQLKAYYPGKYDDAVLDDTQIYVSESLYNNYKKGDMIDTEDKNYERITLSGTSYKILGKIPDDFGMDMIVSDNVFKDMLSDEILEGRQFLVYSDSSDEVISYFKKLGQKYSSSFKVSAVNSNSQQLSKYKENRKVDLNLATLLSAGIFAISLIMIYFTIKSNALSRSEELTVYRLIGITRGSILKTYMLEMTLLTAYTSLPAILITSIVIKFIGSIPSLEMQLLFPWWSVGILLLFMFIINNLISIMPVYGILSKPPAQLAAKE